MGTKKENERTRKLLANMSNEEFNNILRRCGTDRFKLYKEKKGVVK